MSSAIPQKKTADSKSSSQWLLLATLFFLLAFLGGILALLVRLPEGIIARGVSVGPFDVGGLTFSQAAKLIETQTAILEKQGLAFHYRQQIINLPSVLSSPTNPELSAVIFDFDIQKTVQAVAKAGRSGHWLNQFISRLLLRFRGQCFDPVYSLDQKLAKQFLKENLSLWEKPGRNANLQAIFDFTSQSYLVEVMKEEPGEVFDYDFLTGEIQNRFNSLDVSPLSPRLARVEPTITFGEAQNFKESMEKILARGDFILFLEGEKRKFVVEEKDWSQWLKLVRQEEKISFGLDKELVSRYLKEVIGPEMDNEVRETKFEMKGGRVVEFQPGRSGRLIEEEATLAEIEKIIFGDGELVGEVKNTVIEPKMTVGEVNDLGIKEIIGVGRSNFRGSPPNRIHNIKVGAQTLNGILIPPGEVFSLLKALGQVDAEHGYRPELVIKGNQTIPEFGGGLCQIGTTSFRVVLSSGLPILERQNHSYRVSYYEPPIGVDATIYNPRPDLKFLNDTGNYILIQTRIEGTELIFEFWGAKDGRQAAQSEPVVFNRVSPPAPKLIETLDLPVGRKKCTEKPHAGADAIFTYTVTYADGTIKEQEFKSHYRPWGEVCLIGVEKLSEPSLEANGESAASSTLP